MNLEIKKFARYFAPYKWNLILGILFILISMVFGLLIPYYVGRAIDDLSADITQGKIIFYPLVILVISGISGVFVFWQRRVLIDT
ncbi:MAG: hypothetical protein LH472_04685 [Pyrinomonadaceae bacterium]|nr:hypothetical protein [Pyrinomonadaceae bacterium]